MNITRAMHDAALHINGRAEAYGLSQDERYDIAQLANGYVGACDEQAAVRGIAVARRVYDSLGKRCPF